jgi:hypothetical protein
VATTARKGAAKPESQATSYARQKGQQNAMRLGAFLLIVLAFVIPRIPSPIMGMDWWKSVRPSLAILGELMPPDPLDLGLFTVTPRPVAAWLSWLLAAFLAFVAATLFMHVGALYTQRTRPLGHKRTYMRLTVPASTPGKPTDALTLLKSLHGMVPAGNPMQPAAPPLMLCWTARPERKIQQGVSLAPEAIVTSVQKRLLGIRSGTKAVVADDPFLAELQPGRTLCVAEVRTVAGDALPIAVIGKEQTLLAALLPALAPQAGVIASGVRIVSEPIADRLWRLDVLAMLERLKLDAGADEQQALKAKASGPAFRMRIMLLAVADEQQAGVAQVQTIGAALAGSVQAAATQTQRLQAGPAQVFPAVVQPSPPFPRRLRRVGLTVGIILAGLLALLLWRWGLAAGHRLLWAIPPLALWLPLLTLAVRWRKRVNAELVERHAAIIGGLLPPRNPRVVPIWWPWLGRVE